MPWRSVRCRLFLPYSEGVCVDILIMIVTATICLGFLVFIHEGGHFLAARAFGVRVSEFMIGLPGPSVGFTHGETRFGVTAVPLGGYARVCGMEVGEESPHLMRVMAEVYARGAVSATDIAGALALSEDDASDALEELAEWGTIARPKRGEDPEVYRTPRIAPTKRQMKHASAQGLPAPAAHAAGEARPLEDARAFFARERAQQYRSLPFWKRSVILLAGIAMNLAFAVVAFVVIYAIMGFDVQNPDTGAIQHVTVSPLRAVEVGFMYIGMVAQAVVGLFNPQTAADTVSNSTSIMGIAVLSKSAFEAGLQSFLEFTAMISVSLGIMNLLPIPPLDGGRFVVEVYSRLRNKAVSARALNYLSMVGIALFVALFVVMTSQDIQRFVFGNWG